MVEFYLWYKSSSLYLQNNLQTILFYIAYSFSTLYSDVLQRKQKLLTLGEVQ